ncbi:MAG: TrmH family RNA methyltransferase [Acidimicrobiales bacterium]
MTAPRTERGALSASHHRIKRLRRLSRSQSARRAEGAFLIEGPRLLAEALDARAPVEGVYAVAGFGDPVLDRAAGAGLRIFDLAAGVIERVSGVVTPQPVVAVCARVDSSLESLAEPAESTVMVCVDVRDPGNLGTVLRSAEASGAVGVVCCEGTAEVYNPKCVRASAGAIFHTPVVLAGAARGVLDQLGTWGWRRLATGADGGSDLYQADLSGPVAVVLGNEAHGLDPELANAMDELVSIPMAGRSESLNVAMASTVVAFEIARRRR